jgi:hypothetical protein
MTQTHDATQTAPPATAATTDGPCGSFTPSTPGSPLCNCGHTRASHAPEARQARARRIRGIIYQ